VVAAARAAGGEVVLPHVLGIEVPYAYRYAVHVVAGITHTIGGVRIDPSARVLHEDGTPIDGLYAAGVDAGGISTGGYSSGLASALVFGRIAAETAASAS
jgi:succinate dehydrogenase/fumarate reductase flavoprotein subunit